MEGSSPEKAEILQSPLIQVREFVTRVWEHPLVDQPTRNHRKEAGITLADELKAFEYSDDDFLILPVGSVIWTTDDQSDFDYVLIMRNNDLEKQAWEDIHYFRKDLEVQVVLGAESIDTMPLSMHDQQKIAFENIEIVDFTNLFLIPDEYLTGNMQLGYDLRLSVLQRLNRSTWEESTREMFDSAYRNWDRVDISQDVVPKARKKGERNQAARIERQLQRRAQQTHTPDRYSEAFKKARESIQVPSYEMYVAAMKESKGRLSLLPHFSAQGID
jgi:hypothetical protein